MATVRNEQRIHATIRIGIDMFDGQDSKGKILEITPVINDAGGNEYCLPATRYTMTNAELGASSVHKFGHPWMQYVYTPIEFPFGSLSSRMKFIIRVLERDDREITITETPDMVIRTAITESQK